MATLLVTAFGAFPGAPHNPSTEIVTLLDRLWRPRFARMGVRLVTAVLPVVHAIATHLDALVAQTKPDAILHLGLAGQRRRVSVETRARNVVSPLRPDAHGRYAATRSNLMAGAPFLRSEWPSARLLATLRANGVDAELSIDAGDYVCNATLWRSLETRVAPAIFLHVPKKRRVAPEKMATALARVLPGMTLELARAGGTNRPATETR
jgi:pyroglutamyl-peptidase